jgi:hypothetical protein
MTDTAPYLPATEALVKTDHEQRAALELSDGTTTWTTTLLSGDITLDEAWSPRAQLAGIIATSFTPAELAAIDPRKNTVRCTVAAGYVHPDGTVDMHPLLTGHLRDRTARRRGNTVQLEAASDEALAQDAGWLSTDTFKTFTGVTEALEWFASYATGTAVTIDSSVGTGHRADLTSAIPTKPGGEVWEFMSDLAMAANVRLFVDADGSWKIRAKVTEASTTDITDLSTGADSEDTLSRNGYYSAAVLRWEWRDASDVERVITARYGTLPGKVYTETFETAITQAAADTAAQNAVRGLSTRGDSYTCNDVAAYWLRPGDTVRVTLADGTEVDHIAKQIVFHVTSGTMTVTTRQPSNLGD